MFTEATTRPACPNCQERMLVMCEEGQYCCAYCWTEGEQWQAYAEDGLNLIRSFKVASIARALHTLDALDAAAKTAAPTLDLTPWTDDDDQAGEDACVFCAGICKCSEVCRVCGSDTAVSRGVCIICECATDDNDQAAAELAQEIRAEVEADNELLGLFTEAREEAAPEVEPRKLADLRWYHKSTRHAGAAYAHALSTKFRDRDDDAEALIAEAEAAGFEVIRPTEIMAYTAQDIIINRPDEVSRSLDYKESAALLRKALKAEWPGVKFSVRKIHRGDVDISWTDGPTPDQVKDLALKFQGEIGGMDHHTDCWSTEYVYQDLAGEMVCHGIGSIYTERKISEHWRAELAAEVTAVLAPAGKVPEGGITWNCGQLQACINDAGEISPCNWDVSAAHLAPYASVLMTQLADKRFLPAAE